MDGKKESSCDVMAGPNVKSEKSVESKFPSDCDALIVVVVMMHLLWFFFFSPLHWKKNHFVIKDYLNEAINRVWLFEHRHF